IRTGVQQTVLMTGDLERLFAMEDGGGGADEIIRIVALGLAGRRDEARTGMAELRETTQIAAFRPWTQFLLAWLERRPDDMRTLRQSFVGLRIMDDPEAIFQEAWLYCDVGEFEHGLELLRRSVSKGYFVAPTLATRSHFDGLRGDSAFRELLGEAEAGRAAALAAFDEAGGGGRRGGGAMPRRGA